MRRDELNALGDLAGIAAASLADQVRDTHTGIASRVFGRLGPSATPVRAIHDRVTAAAYAGAAGLTGAVVRGGARAASTTRPQDAPSMQDSTSGRLLTGALNGAWGDALERRGSPLTTPIRIRRRGTNVESTRIAIFVHGLCETDDAWRLGAARHVPYGDRFESELGYTSLYVRYNSGLHVSENGRRLAELLDALVVDWPAPVSEIVLIGHSMGGLVARSACHYGHGEGWTANVRHVFTLGTPHRGAPLEQVANVACSALSLLPETRGFATPLRNRSAGIKDLRYGYLLDEDWRDFDPDAFLQNTGRQIPFLDTANHYFVCATVAADPDARLSRIVGDLLVLRASAWSHGGHGERMTFPVDHYRHVGGATHFDLLNHPAIYDQLVKWLTAERTLPAAV
ncbi:MAG: esterase/lipase family protein [Solirubrobacteraceae bacterium]